MFHNNDSLSPFGRSNVARQRGPCKIKLHSSEKSNTRFIIHNSWSSLIHAMMRKIHTCQHMYISVLQCLCVHPTARFPRTFQSTPRRSTQCSSSSQPASCPQSAKVLESTTLIYNSQQITDYRQRRVQKGSQQYLPYFASIILAARRQLTAESLLQSVFFSAAGYFFRDILLRWNESQQP